MNIGAWILSIITAGVIPFIVQFLKKIKLPVKLAPWAAIIVALIIVTVAKAFTGADLDFVTVLGTVAQALGIAGVSVLGYDIWKQNQPVVPAK